MSSNLIEIRDYGIITFESTSYALKAEKVMKKMEKDFMIIPTPREISTSCGLAMKFAPDCLEEYLQILARERVPVKMVYSIEEQDKKKKLRQISLPQD